jgi:dolichyl-diphosphooligosaccharide--protein glycosyltransferase
VRRDLPVLLLILAISFGLRVYLPWSAVFGAGAVDFLENDAWYHIRLIENQVRHWPWRVTLDPYAAPGGQFVPIAPFFDTITATLAVALHGRDATSGQIERIAAFVPPVLGTLTVLGVWALCRLVFDRTAAVLSAALLAFLPGHFLDRTLLGFYDHHALEAALAVATLLAIAYALDAAIAGARPLLAGVALGLYLLGWGSGALLVGVLAVWLTLTTAIASDSDVRHAAQVTGVTALVAMVMVLAFQDASMYRYSSQILALGGLGGLALFARILGRRAIVIIVLAALASVAAVAAGFFGQVRTDIMRLFPDSQRMGVLEARPLFRYSGRWQFAEPWEFFRSGFYVGLMAVGLFTLQVWRARRPADLLLWVFAGGMFVATIGQNRFGYYLVPACAIFGGWLAARILGQGAASTLGRVLAVAAVAGVIFAPNFMPTSLRSGRASSMTPYWRTAMLWLRDNTPAPFAQTAGQSGDYYYARYPRNTVPLPDYSVMNWWDHGYWIVQLGHRVPVSNPTQERAPNAGRFYAATSEDDALAILSQERARYVVADWEIPFRIDPDGTTMGRFQSVVNWAGARHQTYYEVMYRRAIDGWTPVWVFHEPYYRSMAFRLAVLGGAGATPVLATTVIRVSERLDGNGWPFKEIVAASAHSTYEAAVAAAASVTGAERALVVGLNPWTAAFPIEPLRRLHEKQAFRSDEQRPSEAPYVRIFEAR